MIQNQSELTSKILIISYIIDYYNQKKMKNKFLL